MSDISDYKSALEEMVPGNHPVDAATLDGIKSRAISKAMDAHGKNAPQEIAQDIPGDGGFDYAVGVLSSWSQGFSDVLSIEYPVDDDSVEERLLEIDDWQLYRKPAGIFIRLLSDKPQASEILRVTYSAPHVCDASSCTVEPGDEASVQALAAAFYCRMLAAAYALDQDSTVQADTVNQGPRHKAFLTLAEKYEAEYSRHMGVEPGKAKPAVSIRDQDVNYPGGLDRLTHPRRYR